MWRDEAPDQPLPPAREVELFLLHASGGLQAPGLAGLLSLGPSQEAVLLPKESEDLEKQNAALRKEIKQLTEEMKYFTSVLSSHEPLCSVLATGTPSPPEVVYSTHAFHQPHVSSPRFQP
uniref:Basic leucine zipper ATF-like transcription factor n=1 Tax=Equus caballus TaxID=9796 RepID=F6W196_HORSE